MALRDSKKQYQDMQAFDSAFYSTDDESANERSFVDNLMRECQNLPFTAKKQLHVIKEEQSEDQPDYGYNDQMDLMGGE